MTFLIQLFEFFFELFEALCQVKQFGCTVVPLLKQPFQGFPFVGWCEGGDGLALDAVEVIGEAVQRALTEHVVQPFLHVLTKVANIERAKPFSVDEEALGDRRREKGFYPRTDGGQALLAGVKAKQGAVNVEVGFLRDVATALHQPELAVDGDLTFVGVHFETHTDLAVPVHPFGRARVCVVQPRRKREGRVVLSRFHAIFTVECQIERIQHGGLAHPVFGGDDCYGSITFEWD